MNRVIPSYPPYPDDDIYVNAFSRTTGRIVDVPLSQFARVNPGVPAPEPFTGASLGAVVGPPLPVDGEVIIPLEQTGQFPPLSFTVADNEIFFNQLGSYKVNVSGAVTSTPGDDAGIVITAVPTGSTQIIGDLSILAVTNAAGTASFNYPFLTNIIDEGSDLYFTATSVGSNVSLVNGAVDVVKVA